jgi:hypothetical protein
LCFSKCRSLATVTFELGSNATSVHDSAFLFCLSLSSIFIPLSLRSVLWKYQRLLKVIGTDRDPVGSRDDQRSPSDHRETATAKTGTKE